LRSLVFGLSPVELVVIVAVALLSFEARLRRWVDKLVHRSRDS